MSNDRLSLVTATFSCVSSAYCCCAEAISAMGEIQREKRMGSRTDRCGTPFGEGEMGDLTFPTETNSLRLERYALNQDRAVPQMP